MAEPTKDDELFEHLHQTLERYLQYRIGTTLTEYDWRELAYLSYLIDERGGPLVDKRREEIIAWNKQNEEEYQERCRDNGTTRITIDLDKLSDGADLDESVFDLGIGPDDL